MSNGHGPEEGEERGVRKGKGKVARLAGEQRVHAAQLAAVLEEARAGEAAMAAVQLAAEEARRAAAEGEAGSVRTSTSAASFALLTFFAF